MKKRVLALVAVVMLLAVALAPAASAQTEGVADGFVNAQGDGIAILNGRGAVEVSGSGMLWVRDRGGDASIEVTGYGHKQAYDDGWVLYGGFDGHALITGGRIQVVVSGVNVDLAAVGRGYARLWGHGSYQGSTGEGWWTSSGTGTYVNMAP
jgi:hypothetical protein